MAGEGLVGLMVCGTHAGSISVYSTFDEASRLQYLFAFRDPAELDALAVRQIIMESRPNYM